MSDSPATDDMGASLVGQTIGGYEVLELLAEGGMGVVYRGVHPVIKKRVAIKVLKELRGGTLAHLITEAEAVNSIGHRNIVDIFALGQLPDERPYIIMEFLEGEALDQYVARVGSLSIQETAEILFDSCAPLVAAHRARVIHRDLKPSNIFLCAQPDGARFLKLLDFGLAKKALGLDGVTAQSSQISVAGTPDYMAPENARGKAIGPSIDIYALGCIAFELLTGRLPFTASTPMDVMIAHVRSPVPRAAALNPQVPAVLDDLVARMMAKEPADRPRTIADVQGALGALLQALKAAPTAPAIEALRDTVLPSTELPAPGRRRRWMVGALGAAAAAAALVVVVVRSSAAPPPRDSPTGESSPGGTTDAALESAGIDVAPSPSPEEPEAVLADSPEPPDAPVVKTGAPAPAAAPLLSARAPTEAQLRGRLARMERRLRAATPSGAEPDPAALQYLTRYRLDASMAKTAAERARLARQLDQWERLFLGR